MDQPAVTVKDLYKSFRLPRERASGIKGAIVNFYRRKRGYETQRVLKNVSFDIQKGEFYGIVGRNGSGKSTLLKLLAGIYAPDKGLVQVNGSLTPFIELGVGFNPELTGRENVFLNGALLGFNHAEMEEMYDDIVAFAELRRFMDQKLKNYSSGMQVRLAFSIAIRAKSDILLLDEVLAVGDAAFQQKCYNYFEELKNQEKTVIFVSHDMGAVKQFCDKALFMRGGKIEHIGTPEEVAMIYDRANYAVEGEETESGESEVHITLRNTKGAPQTNFEHGEEVVADISWPKKRKVSIVGFMVYKGQEVVFANNTLDQKVSLDAGRVSIKFKATMGDGRYKITATTFGKNRHDIMATSDMHTLLVYGQPATGSHKDEWQGVSYLEHTWGK